ncbi:ABC transporter ATP-binding protein [Gordonia sp. (in: high G+C Gram-positive bacteria)]|uniref:ABC transporter ATP-binding protein n=1 Tax=Gordonia sp. (in: high G+C Gram-positive bacteria) TaxID=84139 RepID=UPI003F9B0ECA
MGSAVTAQTPDIDNHKEQQRAGARALRDLLAPVSTALTVGRVMSGVSAVLAVVPYIALVHIGDALLSGDGVDRDTVSRWLTVLVATFGARLLIYFVALFVTHLADITVGHLIRERIVARLSNVPLTWFTSTNSGRVRKALQDDISTVHQLIAHQPVEGTSAIVMPLGLMAYAFVVDWRLGLLSIATIPLYIAAMALSMRGMGEMTVKMDKRLSAVSSRMVEFVTGIAVVKAFGKVGRAHHSYQRAADDFYEFYSDWVKPLVRVSALGTSLLSIPLLLLINVGVGSVLVHADVVTPADVLAASLIALLVPHSLETVMNSMWSHQLAGASALRLQELIETPTLSDDAPHGDPDSFDIEFDRVSYSYPGTDTLAVDDVSFTLRHGTVTALVGPSGSGKSTVATLLARFDDPASGDVRIGGVPVSQIDDLYSRVGFVLQDPQLLSISIRDNIALGRPDATDEQVRDAARTAQVLDEIDALPNGFETVYGSESGLSGGQAQRVAIARALLVNAPILILDEATALADPEAQHQIQQALSALVAGRTVLVIGHRPEAIRGVDQIVLLDSGRVEAAGTHADLTEHPAYARLWNDSLTTGGHR